MSRRLSPVLAYKKRLWSDVTTKASQYYKGRKNKLDLSYCKEIKLEWNPLLPLASNARWFKRTINTDKYTMDSNINEQCSIIEDMHERNEAPKMTILLNNKLNTRIVFDIRKLRWIHLVNELMLWCDIVRIENQDNIWNSSKFFNDNEINDNLPKLLPRSKSSPLEINSFLFYKFDQPLQPNEFYNQNKYRLNGNGNGNGNGNENKSDLYSYSYSPKMDHKYSNEKQPIWRSDLEFLHKSSGNVLPHIRYDYIVYDDNGLLYPNFNQISKDYLDKIMDAQPHNDILGEYIYKYYKEIS